MKQKIRFTRFNDTRLCLTAIWVAACAAVNSASAAPALPAAALPQIALTPIGTYASGIFDAGGSEITAHDPLTQRLYVVNSREASVNVLDISDPTMPTKI